MKKLRVGIIGCGTIASVHLDAISALEASELIMVCDLKESLVKKVAHEWNCDWTLDYTILLGRNDIDVVHILLPHHLHVRVAMEALQAGKNVVLEKPVGISIEQMKELKDAESASDYLVGVTLQNRFNPTTIKAKELISSGELGIFVGAKGSVTWSRKDGYYSASDWRGRLAFEGGGLLINQAIHTLDLMEYIGGEVRSLQAKVANTTHPEIDVEDTAMVTLSYADGGNGIFFGTNSYGGNAAVDMEFLFEKGKLVFREQALYVVTEDEEIQVAHDVVKKGEKAYWGMSHQLIIEDIYRGIMEDKAPQVTLDAAIRATELVLGSYESSTSGLAYEMK